MVPRKPSYELRHELRIAGAIGLVCCLAAGCAMPSWWNEPQPAPPQSAAPAVTPAEPVAAAPSRADPPPAAVTPRPESKPAAKAAAPAAAPASKQPARKESVAAAKEAPAPAKEAAAPAREPAAAPAVAKQESAPRLDVATLETRLRETKVIGALTKIALKNQIDDLLGKFRAFHKSGGGTPPAALRQPYDSLVLKVLALVQDGDPALARSIVASRESIWNLLADPTKFANLT